MADQLMTSTELAAVIPELWSAKFYPTLLSSIVYNDVVAHDYEGELSSLGDTVNVTTAPEFDGALDLAENDAADAQAVTLTSTPIVVNHQIALDYIVTTKADRQSLAYSEKLRASALHAVAKKMQSLIITDIVASSSAPDHVIDFDSSTTLVLADITEAKDLLDTANVEDAGRVMVTGVAQANDLLSLSNFTSRDYISSGNPVESGQFSSPILGFIPKKTTAMGDTANFFHPLFMQAVVQQSPQVEIFNLGSQGKRALRVNVTVLAGWKQMSDKRVVEMT